MESPKPRAAAGHSASKGQVRAGRETPQPAVSTSNIYTLSHKKKL